MLSGRLLTAATPSCAGFLLLSHQADSVKARVPDGVNDRYYRAVLCLLAALDVNDLLGCRLILEDILHSCRYVVLGDLVAANEKLIVGRYRNYRRSVLDDVGIRFGVF